MGPVKENLVKMWPKIRCFLNSEIVDLKTVIVHYESLMKALNHL